MPDRDLLKEAQDSQPNFARLLQIRVISATLDEVVAEMPVTDALSNRNGVLHGGAIMGVADNMGGTATILNLPEGMSTTTIESKTNFLRPVHIGDVVRLVSVFLHRGRKTMIVQTTILRPDGKAAAITTQTQMVMEWKPNGG